MHPFLQNGDDITWAHKITFRPTAYHARSCSCCSLPTYQGKPQNISVVSTLFNEVYGIQRLVKADTVCIHLYTPDALRIHNRFQLEWAHSVAQTVRVFGSGPRLHLCFDDSKSVTWYKENLTNVNYWWNLIRVADCIEFNHFDIREPELIHRATPILHKVRWNLFDLPLEITDETIDLIGETLRRVQSCYLPLQFGSLARYLPEDQIGWYVSFYMALKKQLPEDLFRKVELDRCLLAAIGYRETGQGCSAGATEFYIWPNGNPTGCPYNPGTKKNNFHKIEEIVRHMRRFRYAYEFDSCQLSTVYEDSRKKIVDLTR
jgi:hypothetical protein